MSKRAKFLSTFIPIVFVAPYVFEHIWWIRLFCILLLASILVYEIIRQIVNPELMFKDDSLLGPKTKKISIWFFRVSFTVIALPLFISWGVYTPSKDLINALRGAGPVRELVTIDDARAGRYGLFIQSFSISGNDVAIVLSRTPLTNHQEYYVTYFPGSFLVYDVQPYLH